VTVTTPTN